MMLYFISFIMNFSFLCIFYIHLVLQYLAFLPFDEVKKREKGVVLYLLKISGLWIIGYHELQKKRGDIMLGSNFQRDFVIIKKGEIVEVFPQMPPPHGFDDNKVYNKGRK